MAAAFPYRGVPGTMPPGVPPPPVVAPIPDYMTEEKLQEKGKLTSLDPLSTLAFSKRFLSILERWLALKSSYPACIKYNKTSLR